jgi:spore germination protein YaaH
MALVFATPAAGQANTPPAAGQASQTQAARSRLVLGYYVPYDPTSWTSLRAHADSLDILATQTVTIDACGNLGSQDDHSLIEFAHAHGLKVVPSLFTLAGWLDHQLLTDPATRQNAVDQIATYTASADYDGFDLDLEGVAPDDRDALTSFTSEVATRLHDEGRLLTLAIPAKTSDVSLGWAGAYDYAGLGAQPDLVTIMAYEYRGPFSGPGSVAPYAWVRQVAAFATSQIQAPKVLLGLAFYGYDWNTTTGQTRAIGYPQFAALAEQYAPPVSFDPTQQSLTLAYQNVAGDPPPTVSSPSRPAHQISVHTPPPCAFEAPPPTPQPGVPPPPPPGTPQDHQVWLEDSLSAAARLTLVDTFGAGGVATWRLGLEDPGVWPVLDTWRAGQ